jgi:hypothetical protein
MKGDDFRSRKEAQRRQKRKGWTIPCRASADRISLHLMRYSPVPAAADDLSAVGAGRHDSRRWLEHQRMQPYQICLAITPRTCWR